MPATTAVLDAVTKEIYEPKIQDQLTHDTVALKRIGNSSNNIVSEVGAKWVTFPIHTRRNSGVGARNELELLPTPGQQGHASGRIRLKYLYGAVKLSGQALALVDKNYQAFQSALEIELDGLKNDIAIDQNRQVWGDGVGSFGTVVSGTGGAGNNSLVLDTVRHFFKDLIVDVYAAGGTTPLAAGRKVLGVDSATKTIILDGAALTPAAGQFITKEGNLNREWTGLKAIVNDTGILYDINPALEPTWKSKIDRSGTERAVSENLFTRMVDDIDDDGGKVTVIFTSAGVRREYASLLMQQRTYTGTTEFKGGFTGIEFVTDKGVVPIVVDKDCPKKSAWFINEDAIKRYREADWQWMDNDGSKWERVTGYDAYQAMMYQYSELGTNRRNTHGRIENIAEDV